jgi:DNA mismatch repair protein MutS
MTNIQDLNLKEIFPLFDFVNNDFSQDNLFHLLSATPEYLDEVLERQHILKCFLQINRPLLQNKSEFNDVYNYLKDYKTREVVFYDNYLLYSLFFRKRERQQERGRIHQLIIYFDKVNNHYFTHLRINSFPDSFRPKIERIIQFLLDLRIEEYAGIARSRGLKISQIAEVSETLRIKTISGEVDLFWDSFFLFEAYLSISKGIQKYNFTFPEFSQQEFSISEFYHPLLKGPVKNSMVVNENVTLITGPNMSGKSTLLKAIGICVYLAHIGLAVPATYCKVPFFDTISVAINLKDDIKAGYSHFMTEVKILKEVLIEASHSKRCFAIFDEIFRGTNAEDALAISNKSITGLAKIAGSYFFISTHHHQLKTMLDLTESNIASRYIECNMENGKPLFTYKLLKGWSDLKIGQIIFEQEGLNELLTIT